MSKQRIIAGNWKMHKTIAEAQNFIRTLLPLISKAPHLVYLAVPFTAIQSSAVVARGSCITIGAQNINDSPEGALTGEVSAAMVKDAGAAFTLIGHSERRQLFRETDVFINRKIKRALKEKLQPILCVGETLAERSQSRTEEVLEKQLAGCLEGLEASQVAQMVIAYEPVWAVGTGKTATPDCAETAHLFCRRWLAKKWDKTTAEAVHILCGGSVNSSNVSELLDQPNVDGVLVGTAALDPQTFAQIINILG